MKPSLESLVHFRGRRKRKREKLDYSKKRRKKLREEGRRKPLENVR
jgi:hypothetical protein